MDVLSSDSSAESTAETFDQVIKACTWCGEFNPLQDHKKYCQACYTKMYRECTCCKKPYPHKRFYKLNERRCNACQKKNNNATKKRRNQKSLEIKCPSTVATEDEVMHSKDDAQIITDDKLSDSDVKKQEAVKKMPSKRSHSQPRQLKRLPTKRAYIPIIFAD